jgi:hypothetical protein
VSERTATAFNTPERAILAHAIAVYAKAQADTEAAARRVRRALAAVARAEGGEDADPGGAGIRSAGDPPGTED